MGWMYCIWEGHEPLGVGREKVIGRMTYYRYACPIPQILCLCYITGKWDFADAIKHMDLKIGWLSWITLLGPIQSSEHLKAENFLQLESEREREIWTCHCSLWKRQEQNDKRCGGNSDLREAPDWGPAKKQEPQSYCLLHVAKFCQKPDWSWKQIFSQSI